MTTFYQTQGTSVIWQASGGDEVLTMTSLANGEGQSGEEHDFGVSHPEKVRIELITKFGTAPSAGGVVDIYWSSSIDGTNYDGECTGSDASYDSEEDMKRLHYVGSLVVSNDTNAQQSSFVFFLTSRWGLPVVANQADQALSATAGDHIVTVTPLNIVGL